MTARDFDFRIWDSINNKMYYIDKVLSIYPLRCGRAFTQDGITLGDSGDNVEAKDDDKLIVDLYLGVKDSFGNKIFANDIVAVYKGEKPKNLYKYIYFVDFEFESGIAFEPNIYAPPLTLAEMKGYIRYENLTIEIVGNMHETEAFLPPLDEED